jgi:hypothetical protein
MNTVPAKAPLRELCCARCGTVFGCNLGNDCWCAAEPVRLPVRPVDANEDCLCPACLRKAAEAATAPAAD